MKITNIEVIPIAMPLAKRYDNHAGRTRMYDIDQHIVVKIHADNGIIGYGDYEDRPTIAPKEVEPLIDRNPFDFLHNNFNMAIGMALYDLMGKYLEVPAYKLLGQKVRDAVPAAAWTRPCPPDIFAEEIQRAVGQGYRIFKMHSDAKYDVIEQTKAAEAVAPTIITTTAPWALFSPSLPNSNATTPLSASLKTPSPGPTLTAGALCATKRNSPSLCTIPNSAECKKFFTASPIST